MTFAFVHNDKAFLPALEAYVKFFSSFNIRCQIIRKNQLSLSNRQLEWFFMGTDLSATRNGICKIHEYISPSTSPFRAIKDWYKSIFNARPHFRIFKNEYVQQSFHFNDPVPFCYQDIGIDPAWAPDNDPGSQKEFDFIYVGDLSRKRRPERLIDPFTQNNMKDHTLLLVSRFYDGLKKKYGAYPNILFRGPVNRQEVRDYIRKSRFGINYIPDVEPFNRLTSTKLLEYAACGIPVISNDYSWIRQFREKYGGNYFFLQPDFANFTWENITAFKYSAPDLKEWGWENQIRQSGILRFLQSKFPELSF